MEIKASVQYNDFVGTSAADISDYVNLDQYLTSKGVDTTKYQPIGVEFFSSYSDRVHIRFICIEAETQEIKAIGFKKDITKDEFFDLFKRFDIILTKKYIDVSGRELDDNTIMIDDRK